MKIDGVILERRGYTLICDVEDAPILSACLSSIVCKPNGDISYVAISIDKKQVKFHRYLLGITNQFVYVDHVNGNPLDNRKANLRICNNAQNQMNAQMHRDKQTKLPKGVTLSKSNPGNPYQVRISHHGRRIQVGYFNTVQAAEAAYLQAAELYHGDFALHKSRKGDKHVTEP